MKITPDTTIHDLLEAHPFLLDFLVAYNPKFEHLNNRVMRATMGRVATLTRVAGNGGVPVEKLMADIEAEIARKTGKATGTAPAATPKQTADKAERLKGIILDLHKGVPFEEVKKRFDETVEGVSLADIATMEEKLIREGLPVQEVQKLCDLHVGMFKNLLDAADEPKTPAGHPVHTYIESNRVIMGLLGDLDKLVQELNQSPDAGTLSRLSSRFTDKLSRLGPLEVHYARKENQIFPFLERHDITAPPKVMWGVHDEIRALMKDLRRAVTSGNVAAVLDKGPKFSRAAAEMVYKENNILFPLTLQTFSYEEWVEIKSGEAEIGYDFTRPEGLWPDDSVHASKAAAMAPSASGSVAILRNSAWDVQTHKFRTGNLTVEQADLILRHLPVDISFVDENDVVRYYSEGRERIFPRSSGVIGRKVQNCHPQKSLHMVEEILHEFRAGKKDTAEFWIDFRGMFVHIRYVAMRDDLGEYRGCLEFTQDVTKIRELKGERKLPDYQ